MVKNVFLLEKQFLLYLIFDKFDDKIISPIVN